MTKCYLLARYDFVCNRISHIFMAGESSRTITRVFDGYSTLIDIFETTGKDYQEANDNMIRFIFDAKCPDEYRWVIQFIDIHEQAGYYRRLSDLIIKTI